MDYYLLDSRQLWYIYISHVKISKNLKLQPVTSKLVNFMECSIAQNQRKKGIIDSAIEWMSTVQFGKDVVKTDLFQEAFHKLDLYEQIIYYSSFIDGLSNSNVKKNQSSQYVSFSVLMRLPTLFYSWGHCIIEIDPETNIVKLNNKPVELKHYLVRKSKNNNKLIIVLEPITINQTPFRISFESTYNFQECFIALNIAMDHAHHEAYRKHELLMKRYNSPMKSPGLNSKISYFHKTTEKTVEIECNLASSLEVFSMLMPNHELQTMTQDDTTTFKTVSQSSKFRLSRSVINNKLVKFVTIVRHPKELVAEVLSDPKYPYWNKEVTRCYILYKDVYNNMALMYQKLRGTNLVPLTRDFVIVRHVFSYGNASFIIEKSINHERIPAYNGVIRGDLVFRLTWIQGEQPDFCWVTILSETNYKCGLPIETETQMAYSYLLEMLDLESYIDRHRRGKTEFDQHWRQRLMPISRLAQLPSSHPRSKILNSSIIGYVRGSVAKTEISDVSLINHLETALYSPAKTDRHYTNQLSPMSPVPCTYKYSRKELHPIWGSDWRVTPQGLVCNNTQDIIKQKNYFKHILPKITSDDYYYMRIPADISTELSMLQVLAKSMATAPILLEYAATLADPIERLKYVMCFGYSMGLLMVEVNIPTWPFLGYTYQGWIHGCPVYLEHTQVIPPISRMLFKGRGYQITGTYVQKLDFTYNDAVSKCESLLSILFFNSGESIEFCFPAWRLQGLVKGYRIFSYRDWQTFVDAKNQLYGEINYDQNTIHYEWSYEDPVPFHGLSGNISLVSGNFVEKYKKAKSVRPAPNQIIKTVSKISGKWTDCLKFDDKIYYDISQQLPSLVMNEEHPLPSDSSMRLDLCAISRKDWPLAGRIKQTAEMEEREDRQRRKQK